MSLYLFSTYACSCSTEETLVQEFCLPKKVEKVIAWKKDGSHKYHHFIDAASSPDGKTIATINLSGTSLNLWDTKTGKLRDVLSFKRTLRKVLYSHDGSFFIVIFSSYLHIHGPEPEAIGFYSTMTGAKYGPTISVNGTEHYIGSIVLSNSNASVYVSFDGRLLRNDDGSSRRSKNLPARKYDIQSGKMIIEYGRGDVDFALEGRSLAISYDDRFVVSGVTRDGAVLIWDEATGKELRRVAVVLPKQMLDPYSGKKYPLVVAGSLLTAHPSNATMVLEYAHAGGGIVSFDVFSGDILWRKSIANSSTGLFFTPGGRYVVSLYQGMVFRSNKDGELKWNIQRDRAYIPSSKCPLASFSCISSRESLSKQECDIEKNPCFEKISISDGELGEDYLYSWFKSKPIIAKRSNQFFTYDEQTILQWSCQ